MAFTTSCAASARSYTTRRDTTDLDEYWTWHRRAEFQRNYLQNYADATLDGHPLREAA